MVTRCQHKELALIGQLCIEGNGEVFDNPTQYARYLMDRGEVVSRIMMQRRHLIPLALSLEIEA